MLRAVLPIAVGPTTEIRYLVFELIANNLNFSSCKVKSKIELNKT